jgi:hypothetical protein
MKQAFLPMKKQNSILRGLLVVALAFLLIQCGKDEDSLPKSNSVKMDGQSFKIVSASMIGVSMDENGHTSISLVTGSDTEAKILTMDVESFSRATIEGEYAYPQVGDKKLLDDWLTNYTVVVGSSMESTNLESGEVSVIHNGEDNYTVELNLTMDNGVTFTGSYSGDFQVMFYN